MLRHLLFAFIQIVAMSVTGVMIGAAAGMWVLSRGPVTVDFMSPYVEQALNETDLGGHISIGHTVLTFLPDARRFDLSVTDVALENDEGHQVAKFDDVRVGLSLDDLIAGDVKPIALAFVGPEIAITRHHDGSIEVDMAALSDAAFDDIDEAPTSGDDDLSSILDRFLAGPSTQRGFATVVLRDATLTINDHVLDQTWNATDVQIRARRGSAKRLFIRTELTLAMPSGAVSVEGTVAIDEDGPSYDIDATFRGLMPSDIARLLPATAGDAAALKAPVDGVIRATMNAGFVPQSGSVEVTVNPGYVEIPALYAHPLEIEFGFLEATFDDAGNTVDIEVLYADLGVPTVEAEGRIAITDGVATVDVGASVLDLPTDSMGFFWPETAAVDARDWVIPNLSDGTAYRSHIAFSGEIPLDDPEAIVVTHLGGTVAFEDVTVDYFNPLPPATGVTGQATFDIDTFLISIEQGALLDLSLGASRADILGLATLEDRIEIDLDLDGPLATALTILDHQPLGYAAKLGLSPEEIAGRSRSAVSFYFPLRGFDVDKIEIDARSDLVGVVLPGVAAGHTLTDGDLNMRLTVSEMHVAGNGRVAGVPVSLDWQENFSRSVAPRSTINAKALMSDADRVRFGIDTTEFVQGPIAVDLDWRVQWAGDSSLNARLDLDQTRFGFEPFHFEKAPGTPALLTISAPLASDGVLRVIDFAGSSDGLVVDGVLAFQQGQLSSLSARRLTLVDSDVRLTADRTGTGWDIAVTGERIDLRPLINDLMSRDDGEGQRANGQNAVDDQSDVPLSISVDVREGIVPKDRRLVNLTGDLMVVGDDLTDLMAKGTLADAPISLLYRDDAGGTSIVVDSDDAGALLSVLDITDGVDSGSFDLSAASESADGPLIGTGSIQSFTLTEAPALARIVNAMSITGFRDLLRGDPLAFDRLDVDFSYEDDVLTVDKGRAAGASLGLTGEGTIDLDAQDLDMSGVIVPVRQINQILEAIPLIGPLLTGGEGQGIFASTYQATGDLDDPQVDVNALSTLAPGFLRSLFFGTGTGTIEPPTVDSD